MFREEIIGVYSVGKTHKYTLWWGENVELLNIKAVVRHNCHCVINSKVRRWRDFFRDIKYIAEQNKVKRR